MPDSRVLRVLIADDEALGRHRLEDLLRKEGGVEVVGTADDGQGAVEAIKTLRPDLVFLDIQMPGRTGLEVVRDVGAENMPPTIFVTAFDYYAIAAFDVAAADYLVKPFDDERFEQAFRRARRMIELNEVGRLTERLRDLLGHEERAADPAVAKAQARHLERIAVEMRGQVRVVPVETIDYITASGPYAEIHVGEKTYVIRERMQTLEERLDPTRFFRIHRSVIVRLERIESLLREPGGDYAVHLKSGARLSVSRNRVEPLEQWMGLPR